MVALPEDLDVNAFIPMLRQWAEDPIVVRALIYGDFPLFGLLEKVTDAGGQGIMIPAGIAGSGGGSPQMSAAYNNQTSGEDDTFQVPLNDWFQLGSINNKTWRISQNKSQAYRQSLEWMATKTMKEAAKNTTWRMYRFGTGTMGVIKSISAGGVVVLQNPTDAMIFNRGDILQAYSGDGTGTPLVALGYVLGADPTSTTSNLVLSPNPVPPKGGAPGLPSGWSNSNPYLVPQGGFNNDVKGLAAWHPLGTPTNPVINGGLRPVSGTPCILYGVDQSSWPQKLAGTFVGQANTPSIEEQLINLVTAQTLFGGKPDCILVHPTSYAALEKAMTGRRAYQWLAGAHEGVGFSGIRISAGGSEPIVIPDPSAIPRTAQSLQLDTIRLQSAGAFPSKLRLPSGAEYIDIYNADVTQMRFGGHYAITDNGPMYNACGPLSQ